MRDRGTNYPGFEENAKVQTERKTQSFISNDAIYLVQWGRDSDRGSAAADVVSNSSQSKLRLDEENILPSTDSVSGIRKTVTVSTHSVRI